MAFFKHQDKRNSYHEKIEVTLTKSGIITRLAFLVITLSVASFAFYNIFTKVLHTESGWQMINANTKSVVGSEFAFNYQIGVSGTSASIEWSSLNKLYPILLDEGYKRFSNVEVPGTGNLYQLNAHPNEEVYLEPELYSALCEINEAGTRFIFYAPVYAQYKALFSCGDEYAAADFDPFENKEIEKYLKNVCDYAKDKNHIELKLLANNKAKLIVSDEYLKFAKENEIEEFIDLYFARNAFLLDYVADGLIQNGFTAGVITSVEGYVRALGNGDYSLKYFLANEGKAPKESIFSYTGPKSIVSLRDFPLYREENKYFFTREDGSIRHIYIDPETGLCRDGLHQVLASSDTLKCGTILINLYDAFVSSEESVQKLDIPGINIHNP